MAHGIFADCHLKGDRVEIEAYFDDDTPAAQALVNIQNGAKKVIAEGTTDAKGLWSFPRPAPGVYDMVVDAGVGHKTKPIKITIPAADEAPQPKQPVKISEGPSRPEATRFPWERLALGLLLIAAASGLFLLVSRWRRRGADR